MKKLIAVFLFFAMVWFSCMPFPICAKVNGENKINVNAKAWLVMDKSSARVLREENADAIMPIASTTKIMSAIIVIENLNMNDVVTVSKTAAQTEGSSMYLSNEQKISVENLLYGLILCSGNDSAQALCEYYNSKNTSTFIEKMNKKAMEIGCRSTSFKNPHGLDEDGHFSTARDLALITQYALNNEVFSKIVSTKEHTYYDDIRKKDVTIYSTNKFLQQCSYAYGVKTGYTEEAGKCLVGYAKRGEKEIITVLLGCTDTVGETEKLCEKIFSIYDYYTIIPKGTKIGTIKVKNANVKSFDVVMNRDVGMLLTKDELGVVRWEDTVQENIEAPIRAGTVVASVKIYFAQELTLVKDVKTVFDIGEKKNIFMRFMELFKN